MVWTLFCRSWWSHFSGWVQEEWSDWGRGSRWEAMERQMVQTRAVKIGWRGRGALEEYSEGEPQGL